jgi:hypothetical protein
LGTIEAFGADDPAEERRRHRGGCRLEVWIEQSVQGVDDIVRCHLAKDRPVGLDEFDALVKFKRELGAIRRHGRHPVRKVRDDFEFCVEVQEPIEEEVDARARHLVGSLGRVIRADVTLVRDGQDSARRDTA